MASTEIPVQIRLSKVAQREGLIRAARMCTLEARLNRMQLNRIPFWSPLRRMRARARFNVALALSEDIIAASEALADKR